ncbi:MAG TPA: metalloregulator ArsR/SmtB family transcription factor [Gemmatimonadales bacterium]|nr:metalloregulator ArsR/SmtB family transcription factor [Gemmatimonadales bacterium]
MSSSRGAAVQQAAPVFSALGDTTRLALVRRLSTEGPLSITRLSDGSGMTRQAITRHLHSLGKAGLVRHAKSGRERVFSLDLKRLDVARQYLDHVSAQWDAAAARLKQFVENDPE